MTILQSIGRDNLPAEFYDVTSRQLLIQPEPMYAHARLILQAISMELDTSADLVPMAGRDLPGGASSYPPFDSQQLALDQPFYTDAIKVVPDFLAMGGLPVGHALRMNRPRFRNTTYTMASREIPKGTSISTTPVKVGSDQVEITIKLYGGPLDENGVIAPLGISHFDAKRSVHSLPSVREMHFKQDFHKTLDTFGVTLFDAVDSGNILYNDGMTADNDSVVAGDFPFTFALLMKMQRKLDDLSIPLFGNGKRMAVLSTLQAEQLARDPEWQRLSVFTPSKNPLLVGSYVGTVGQLDVFKSATATRTNNSSSVPIHRAQMFGPGMVGVGPGAMPRVVSNVQDNYGLDPIAIWLFPCAFGVLDGRFGVSGRSS